jgi:hypothetical protein
MGRVNQLLCADYLRNIANLIEKGALSGFELTWGASLRKPQGRLVTAADFLICPMEVKFDQAVEDYKAEQERKNLVVDATEHFKDHTPCPAEVADQCHICSTKLS